MERHLHRLEQQTHRAYWSDGLLDLFCGASLLAIGASWLSEWFIGSIAPALLVALWGPARARFTEPRLGAVEFSDDRQRRTRAFIRLSLITGLATFVLAVGLAFVRGHDVALSQALVKAMPGGLVGLAGVVAGEALQLRRLLVYGALMIASGVAVAAISAANPGWPFVIGGAAALVVGVALARRFARRHPLPRGGEAA